MSAINRSVGEIVKGGGLIQIYSDIDSLQYAVETSESDLVNAKVRRNMVSICSDVLRSLITGKQGEQLDAILAMHEDELAAMLFRNLEKAFQDEMWIYEEDFDAACRVAETMAAAFAEIGRL